MTRLIQLLLAVTSLASLPLQSQTITVQEMIERGEMDMHGNYSPKSMESLVGTSTLIVKGSFGEFLGNKPFFGYSAGKIRQWKPLLKSMGSH